MKTPNGIRHAIGRLLALAGFIAAFFYNPIWALGSIILLLAEIGDRLEDAYKQREGHR